MGVGTPALVHMYRSEESFPGSNLGSKALWQPSCLFFLRVTIIYAEMSLIWGEKRYEKDYPGWTSPKFCYSVQTPNGINIVSTGLMDDI